MIPNSVLNKGKCAILTLFKDTEVFSSGSDKANLLILFPRTIILLALDDYWYLFTSCFRFTNLKLQYNPVSHRIVKKMITNLDQTLRRLLQMVFWWWFWRSEYSYILNDLFSMYFIWKVSFVVPVFKNVKKLCE